MKFGIISSSALGIAVALTLGSAPARAQGTGTDSARTDTTGHARMSDSTMHHRRTARSTHRRHLASAKATSTTRIPVTKQTSGGEVMDTTTPPPPPPVVDTTTPPPPPPAVDTTTPPPAPPETTTVAPPPPPPITLRHIGSFYWGIGAGANMPSDNMRNGYGTSWNVMVPFGWDAQRVPLGLRFDADYGRLAGRSDVGVPGDLAVWSGNADAKLRLGSLLRHFYVLGGVGAARVVGQGNTYTLTPGTNVNTYNGTYPTGTVANSFGNAKTEFTWNAGGGVDFGWNQFALFLESRYIHVNTNDTFGANTRFVPIILGLTFR